MKIRNPMTALALLLVLLFAPAMAWAEVTEGGEANVDSDVSAEAEKDEDEFGRKTLSLGVTIGLWATNIDAEVQIPNRTVAGTPIDLDGDLDFDETFIAPQIEVFFTSRFFSVYFDYFRVSEKVNTTLDASLTFAGVTFNANFPVESEFEIETAALRLKVTPLSFELFEIGAIIGARYYQLFGEIRSRDNSGFGSTAPSASESIEGPVPFIGVSAAVFLGFIEVYGYVQGVSVNFDDDSDSEFDVNYFEAEFGVALNIGDHLAIIGGVRVITLEVTETETDDSGPVETQEKNEFEINQAGPFLALRVRF